MAEQLKPKLDEYSPEWLKAREERLVADYGDQYISCRACGYPTHRMYICQNCGCDDPSG